MISEEPIITTQNLSIGYTSKSSVKVVCEGISLNALRGELIGLIGGNGIGKSTLLRTLAGFQSPVSGDVRIRGKNLHSYSEKQLAKLLSFVSTEIIRVSNLTVFDLVALGRYPHTNWSGRLTSEDRLKVEEAIDMTGLRGFENRMVNSISDGERQKSMIARTLAQDTEIILLDEPTAFLDLSNKYEIVHILHRLANEKDKTILFSTHDLSAAISQCDRIWLMLEKEVKDGSPEDLILSNSFSSLFHHKNLFFDPEKGVFRMEREKFRKILVAGIEGPLQWTVKALERNGFEVIENKRSFSENDLLEIEVTFHSWNLKTAKSRVQFDSLYQLCRYLKQFKKRSLT